MSSRVTTGIVQAGLLLVLVGGTALAQGTGSHKPLPVVPHHKVTPEHYMKHPRPVPEPQVTDQLNAMSLAAAQAGKTFSPPPPGTEHEMPGTASQKPGKI